MINPVITGVLENYNIPQDDGVAYLLSVHYGCIPSYIPPLLIQRINTTNILGYSNNELVWNIPLFIVGEEPLGKWEWVVKEYMEAFGASNPKRKGTKTTCIARMKAFFAENPEVRKEEVMGAVKMYIQNLNNSEYLITSHFFIFKDKGVHKTSPLEEWIEKYRLFVSVIPSSVSEDLTNRMQ